MKNRFSFSGLMFAGMALIALFMSSCSSDLGYKAAIPSDAPVVLELDMQSLTLKSNVLSYKEQLADILESMDEPNEMILKFAEKLRKADNGGLNFKKPVYLFTTSDMDGIFLLTAVKRKQQVIDLLLNMPLGVRVVEDEQEGVVWLEREGLRFGALTEEAFLLGVTEKHQLIEKMIRCESNFFGTKMGGVMARHAGDITLMVNCPEMDEEVLEDIVFDVLKKVGIRAKDLPVSEDQLLAEIRKIQAVANIKFQKGQISFNLFSASDEKSPRMCKPISQDVIDKIPSRGLIAMLAIGIDGAQVSKWIEDEVAKNSMDLDNESRMGLKLISSFVQSVNGTAALSLEVNNWNKDPHVSAWLPIAKAKSEYLFDILADRINAKLYLTGDDRYTAVSSKADYDYNRYSQRSELASHAASNLVYGYVDIRSLLDKYIENKRRGASMDEDAFFNELAKFLGVIGYGEMKVPNYDEVSFILTLQDDSRNALDLLLANTFRLGVSYIQMKEAQRYSWDPVPYSVSEDEDYWDEWDMYDEAYPVAEELIDEYMW